LAVAGLGVYGFYDMDRSEKWILIVSYALLVVAVLVTLVTLNILKDTAIATYVLVAIALHFLVGFLYNRSNWGLLIPAYVMLAVGVMVGLMDIGFLTDLLVPANILIAIALPFFVVYSRDTKKWWALIPGGITTLVEMTFLIAETAKP
jgi:hypothetical protein